jgi:hypothetical protein
MIRLAFTILTLLVLSLLLSIAAQEPVRQHAPPGGLVMVAGMSPFTSDCVGQQAGTDYRNTTVESMVAVDPSNAGHLVGVWQQDRWLDGGASGVLAAVSFDRGRTWATSAPAFSRCTGGADDRASDPWVTIAPDGTVYFAALGLNDSNRSQSVLVSRSGDGGFSWSNPATLIVDGATSIWGDDKESITADPTDPRYVYATWDRSNGGDPATFLRPAYFSRSTDGGATWEPARVLYDGGLNVAATINQIVVLPDGTLVDVFIHTINAASLSPSSTFAVVRSTDHGATWTPRQILGPADGAIGVLDVKAPVGVRSGTGIPGLAVDPRSGTLYMVWEDARFSGGQREGIAFAHSTDGGNTWSLPIQVNQVPDVQAFTPMVAVGAGGAIAVTYYDFRNDTPAPAVLLTSLWRIVSTDGGNTWHEDLLADPFDILAAPRSGSARVHFLGDYQGLAATHDTFVAFFTAANSGAINSSSLFATSSVRPGGAVSYRHVEINRHPQPYRPKPVRGAVPQQRR